MPGTFGSFAAFKRVLFRALNVCKTSGMPPLSRDEVFKWALKGTCLACENLMIAAEVLGFNTCPMEGFDGRRLAKYLELSREHHEIVMVIAIGKRAPSYNEQPQWRRPLDATVTVL
jgi:nitroreductase